MIEAGDDAVKVVVTEHEVVRVRGWAQFEFTAKTVDLLVEFVGGLKLLPVQSLPAWLEPEGQAGKVCAMGADLGRVLLGEVFEDF